MNVACPSCSTRYSVDDARIPPSGVTIKCPKCQHVFVAKKDAAQAEKGSVQRQASAVALPGTAAPGSRGSPVPLPGRSGQSKPGGAARGEEDSELDLGLDDHPAAPPPKAAPKAAPAPAPAKSAPSKPAPAAKSAADALDFIDDTAGRRGVGPGGGGSNEFRVRRRNGRVEGPFGVGRIVTMLKNKEFTGGEDISEDGLSWRSMTSNPDFNKVLNDLAAAEDGGLNFGNLDLASDLPAPRAPSKAGSRSSMPPPKAAGGASMPAPRAAARDSSGGGGGGLELSSPLDGISKQPSTGEFDLGLEDDAASEPLAPPSHGAKKPSVPYGPGINSGGEDDLDLDRSGEDGGHAPPPPKKAPAANEGGHAPRGDGANADALEVGEIPELPPIWKTYKKPIIAFVGVIVVFLAGVFTHLFTPCGAYGIKCLGSIFTPPPPAAPVAPPPPPPKLADAKEIATLIDEGSYEGFRSVLATVEKLGPAPDNVLAAAKARGLAAIAYGTNAFPLPELTKAVEALNTLDLKLAAGGNAAAANLEIAKARETLDILNGSLDQAAARLTTELEQRNDDKELAYLLGVARARQGKSKEALDALDKAIVVDPKFAPALHLIGDIVASMGSPEDAALWYLKALGAKPGHSRSAVAAAAIFKKLNKLGDYRRVLAMAGEKVTLGLPPEQRAPFLFEAAAAFEAADKAGKAVALAQEAARLEPGNTQYVALAAIALGDSGNPKQGLAMLDPAIAREANNVEALLARARIYIMLEDVAKAFIDLEAAKKVAPKEARVLVYEARFNVELAKLSDAREALNKAIKLPNPGPVAFVDLGHIDLTLGDVDAALKNATEAENRDKNSASAHALLGDCYLSRDELDKAVAEYKRAIELDDENVQANLGYANSLRDSGAKSAKARNKVAEAIPIYLRLLNDNPTNPTIMFEYGRALEISDDVTSALELYREASALDEKDVRPHLKMAAAFLEKTPPDLTAAAKSINTARRIEAGAGRVNGHVRFWEGRHALLEKRTHDGEAALRSAVEAEPRNALFHYWLGRALEENNSLYEAIGYYEKAVSLNSRLAVAQRALGRTAIERNQFEKAREWFERYRESAPDDCSIQTDIGESYNRQNLGDQAYEAFQKAVKCDANSSRALLAIGEILAQKGKDAEAMKFFERAAKSNAGFGDAWCQYGLMLARVKVTDSAREALERCIKTPNSSEDLRTGAKEALETADGPSAGYRKKHKNNN